MGSKYVMALDQGATSSKAIIFDQDSNVVAFSSKEFPQIYPQPGWVEHDPLDIWTSQIEVVQEALQKAGISPHDISAIGITNRRETTILWDEATGQPVYNAIVWQCRRTAPLCEELKRNGWTDEIRRKTGLVVDAYA